MSFSKTEQALNKQNFKQESDNFRQDLTEVLTNTKNLSIDALFNNISRLEKSKKKLSFILREIDLCVNRS